LEVVGGRAAVWKVPDPGTAVQVLGPVLDPAWVLDLEWVLDPVWVLGPAWVLGLGERCSEVRSLHAGRYLDP